MPVSRNSAPLPFPSWKTGAPRLPAGRAARKAGALSWGPLFAALWLSALLFSCAAPRGFVPISEPGALEWTDDAGKESLETAIAHSISYYRRLPAGTVFRYGQLSYSPEEMARSHRLFLRLWRGTPDSERLAQRLQADFHVFESVAPTGSNLFTGYFEPFIEGKETPQPGFDTPIYPAPDDLIKIPLSPFGQELPSRTLIGRVENGRVVPYFSRREIQEGHRLEGRVRPLAYVNEVDLFFLQIQGSGVVRLPGGRERRVNYAVGNGHPYRSIGAHLIRQGVLTREEVSMQSIRSHLADNPEKVRPLLFTNPSYTFFSPGEEGPLGNIRVPLTPGRSLALDHRLFPRGGLAYISSEAVKRGAAPDGHPLRRFMVVQDTGGVIRGHGRADIFWGNGKEAELTAGHMKQPGRLFLLVASKEALKRYFPGEKEIRAAAAAETRPAAPAKTLDARPR